MSQSAKNAKAFYRDVAASNELWTLGDEEGYPAPAEPDGKHTQPFWSSLSRVTTLQRQCESYSEFTPERIEWADFVESWIPELEEHDTLVGVNWSGRTAVGFSLKPAQVVANVDTFRKK